MLRMERKKTVAQKNAGKKEHEKKEKKEAQREEARRRKLKEQAKASQDGKEDDDKATTATTTTKGEQEGRDAKPAEADEEAEKERLEKEKKKKAKQRKEASPLIVFSDEVNAAQDGEEEEAGPEKKTVAPKKARKKEQAKASQDGKEDDDKATTATTTTKGEQEGRDAKPAEAGKSGEDEEAEKERLEKEKKKKAKQRKKTHKLTIGHLNMQSMCNKRIDLKALLLCLVGVHVMTLSETWLKLHHTNEHFAIPGYTIAARKDRDKGRGGGVLIYVRKDSPLFSFKECPVQLAGEMVCVELLVGGRGKDDDPCGEIIRIVDVYLPPSADLQEVEDNINKLKGAQKCYHNRQECSCHFHYVCLGDFNVDFRSKSSKDTEKVIKLTKLNFQQLVNDFTRKCRSKVKGKNKYNVTKTMIDLIFTDNTEWDARVIPTTISDHYMVCCSREVKINDGDAQQVEAWSRDLKEQRKTDRKTYEPLLKLMTECTEAKVNDKWDLFNALKNMVEFMKKKDTR